MRIGGVEARERTNHFPFAASEAAFDREIGTRSPQVATAVTDYWKSLRPYRGGDERLYALASIRNGKEHWKLRATVYSVAYVQVTFRDTTPWRNKIIDINSTPGAVHEVELFRSAKPATDYHLSSLVQISFEDFRAFGDHDAVGALQQQARQVRAIVNETEAICRRLGLI
jgi:hypothetical protein